MGRDGRPDGSANAVFETARDAKRVVRLLFSLNFSLKKIGLLIIPLNSMQFVTQTNSRCKSCTARTWVLATLSASMTSLTIRRGLDLPKLKLKYAKCLLQMLLKCPFSNDIQTFKMPKPPVGVNIWFATFCFIFSNMCNAVLFSRCKKK